MIRLLLKLINIINLVILLFLLTNFSLYYELSSVSIDASLLTPTSFYSIVFIFYALIILKFFIYNKNIISLLLLQFFVTLGILFNSHFFHPFIEIIFELITCYYLLCIILTKKEITIKYSIHLAFVIDLIIFFLVLSLISIM